MCFPPLTWQTYDIDFTAARYDGGEKTENARVTIKHKGVITHENLELPHHTPGKIAEGPEPGPHYLQGHGDPVVYRVPPPRSSTTCDLFSTQARSLPLAAKARLSTRRGEKSSSLQTCSPLGTCQT